MNLRPRRILIVLHGSIGDVARALPLANTLRRAYPEATLAWSVEPPSAPLVARHPAVDEVIVFDRPRWWRALPAFARRIRNGRFDLVLDLQRHFKSGLVSLLSGAPVRLGFHRLDAKEGNWIFNNHFIPAFGDGLPKLEHYMKFADYLGLERGPLEWRLEIDAAEAAAVRRLLEGVSARFAVLFAGARWESKRWFADQIAECARMLQQRYDLDVVLLGGKDEAAIAAEAVRRHGERIADLVGRTSLREALGVIARAQVAVGPDTGLAHLAAAVGTPVISLWGATSPLRTGPHGFGHLALQGRAPCAPCYRRRCPIGRICMRSIAVEEIADKVQLALAEGPDAKRGTSGFGA
ncbi:MAG TPA: glycosyltransferase family 9 protein [candidate division Zixibacteria bacterium]|nr:glycosyltransferase family 9 protein [candidate division Zixibacteria bacterium]